MESQQKDKEAVPAKIMTKSGIKQLFRLFNLKRGISQPLVIWVLKNKKSIRLRKKENLQVSQRTLSKI